MTHQKLQDLKRELVKDIDDPNLIKFFDTAFQNIEINPESVVVGCTELITTGSIQDISSVYILGAVSGLALAQAVYQGR